MYVTGKRGCVPQRRIGSFCAVYRAAHFHEAAGNQHAARADRRPKTRHLVAVYRAAGHKERTGSMKIGIVVQPGNRGSQRLLGV